MQPTGDYIDGGSGDDCIVLEGSGNRVVLGGSGNDRTITVPAGTSDATIQDIFAHCSDPAYLASQYGGAPSASPQAATPPRSATTEAPTQHPKGRLALEVDGEIIAIFLAAVVALVALASRLAR